MSSVWTILPTSVGKARLQSCAYKVLCGALLFVLLAACSASDDFPSDNVHATGPRFEQNALAPISALPPGGTDRPLLPGQSGTQYTPDGMPALLPAKGVSADQLFSEKLKDEKARIDRLENAVVDLRREFDAMKPAIIRLSAVEGDMQDLLGQLQTLTGTPPTSQSLPDAATQAADTAALESQMPDVGTNVIPPPPAAPLAPHVQAVPVTPVEAAPVAAKSVATPIIETKTTSVISDGSAVTGIRNGAHDDVARLVLDMSDKAAYTRNLDNSEHVLMIELPDTTWSAPNSGSFKSSLLQSWSVSKSSNGKGALLALQLSGPASIAYESVMPGKDGAGARLIIDLKPAP